MNVHNCISVILSILKLLFYLIYRNFVLFYSGADNCSSAVMSIRMKGTLLLCLWGNGGRQSHLILHCMEVNSQLDSPVALTSRASPRLPNEQVSCEMESLHL